MRYFYFSVITVLAGLVVSCSSGIPDREDNSDPGKISDDTLLALTQYNTFRYFWDGAEPSSGMARERIHIDEVYPQDDKNVVTTGGSGFGIMAIISGMERGYISRADGYKRILKITEFLKKADRFHGAWPHWLFGKTGKVKPFSAKDNGADIVETSYLIQGLLAARQYFHNGNSAEQVLALKIDTLWREVEWTWFTRGGQKVLYWHWSPEFEWEMNFPIRGYNECLITYILAASSPTFPVDPEAYHQGWARNGRIRKDHEKYGYALNLRHNYAEEYGGPLFWAHFSFLGLDPRGLKDRYADYWEHNRNQVLINREWCIRNPLNYKGYSYKCWGLTSSYSLNGYAAHAPGKKRDRGVISPTAALSSFPYTPEYSMDALRYFNDFPGKELQGKYGFYDAFSEQNNWFPRRYLAIDQGPTVVMIENYRSALLWNLFMSCPEIEQGLKKLGFEKH